MMDGRHGKMRGFDQEKMDLTQLKLGAVALSCIVRPFYGLTQLNTLAYSNVKLTRCGKIKSVHGLVRAVRLPLSNQVIFRSTSNGRVKIWEEMA